MNEQAQRTKQSSKEKWRPWWVRVWRWVCTRWKQLHLDIAWPTLVLAGATLFAIAYPNERWFFQAEPPVQTAPLTYGDVAELLIVPLTLAVVAYAFSRYQRREDHEIASERRETDQQIAADERATEREIARDRNEEAELQTYFDRMSELMLTHKLRPQLERNENEETDTTNCETASIIARARTLAILRSMQSPIRKASVLRFLYESRLIDRGSTVVDLRGADLRRANLREANLSGADLGETDLGGADLCEARLHGATLREAILRGAKLRRANLTRADLSKATLQGATLYGATLRGAKLHEAILRESDLTRADLTEANLGEISLKGSILEWAYLSNADLHNATLRGAKLHKADLTGAELDQANLFWADLRGADLRHATLERVTSDKTTNFDGAHYNKKTTPPPGGFPDNAINVDEQDA
jgi:uncharacterized protein YjbI with pentapeptide repeats